jgi:hypothetical protein
MMISFERCEMSPGRNGPMAGARPDQVISPDRVTTLATAAIEAHAAANARP